MRKLKKFNNIIINLIITQKISIQTRIHVIMISPSIKKISFNGDKWHNALTELKQELADPNFIEVHCVNDIAVLAQLKGHLQRSDFEMLFYVVDNTKKGEMGFDIIIRTKTSIEVAQWNLETSQKQLTETQRQLKNEQQQLKDVQEKIEKTLKLVIKFQTALIESEKAHRVVRESKIVACPEIT